MQSWSMRNVLVLVVLLGLGVLGYLGYKRFLAPAEVRACDAVASRCKLDADQTKLCRRVVDEVEKAAGGEAADKLAKCLTESRTCPETAGCVAGSSASLLSRTTLEFLDGLRRGSF
jgi:hypothetical protein